MRVLTDESLLKELKELTFKLKVFKVLMDKVMSVPFFVELTSTETNRDRILYQKWNFTECWGWREKGRLSVSKSFINVRRHGS